MKLRFTPRALRDLDEIRGYVMARSPNGAAAIKRRLESVFVNLSRNPEIGRRTSNNRLRRCVATPLPYLVFYEVTTTDVLVIAVRHAARDPSSMPDN